MSDRIFYKYVEGESALAAIAAGWLKFTPAVELNDPMELLTIIDPERIKRSLSDLRATGYSQRQFDMMCAQQAMLALVSPSQNRIPPISSIAQANVQLQHPIYDDLGYMAIEMERLVDHFRRKLGILSLTERPDCLPMWAHYADNANGFLVRYEALADVFPQSELPLLDTLREVDYSAAFHGVTFDPATVDRLFFAKLPDWSYEAEWRVVTPLAHCTRQANGPYLRQIPASHVTRIICGWNVAEDVIARLRATLPAANPGLRLVKTHFDGYCVRFDDPEQTVISLERHAA